MTGAEPTAAELLLLQEMTAVRDDWENPMHEWVNFVAALASKNPWRISRSIIKAKTSPWTQQALERELSTAMGRNMLCEENAEPDSLQAAYDLEEKQAWLDEQAQRNHDATEWMKMHPNDIDADVPLPLTEAPQTQPVSYTPDESDDQPLFG